MPEFRMIMPNHEIYEPEFYEFMVFGYLKENASISCSAFDSIKL